jgi:putative flippase GtrA
MKLPLVVRYAAFAALAIAVNLLTQWLCTALGWRIMPRLAETFGAFGSLLTPGRIVYWAALAAGTLTGFAVKYLLDKNFIFRYRAASAGAGFASLILYGVTAVITTLVFWGVQYAFTRIGPEDVWKYLGGVCGLVPGYVLKYFLDKRFVFRTATRD